MKTGKTFYFDDYNQKVNVFDIRLSFPNSWGSQSILVQCCNDGWIYTAVASEYYDGPESNSFLAIGSTEQKAIDNLVEQLEEMIAIGKF